MMPLPGKGLSSGAMSLLRHSMLSHSIAPQAGLGFGASALCAVGG